MPQWSYINYGYPFSEFYHYEDYSTVKLLTHLLNETNLKENVFIEEPNSVNEEFIDDYIDESLEEINTFFYDKFKQATINILNNLGCTYKTTSKTGHLVVTTKFGLREISVLSLGVNCVENSDRDDQIVGFSITSRYFPSVLDFSSQHGGIEEVIEEDFTKFYPIIREEIEKIHPVFKEFKFSIQETFS